MGSIQIKFITSLLLPSHNISLSPPHPMIHQVLQKLDLDEKEITAYLRLLRTGSLRASTLAYQMDLPRTTAQNILLRLERDGLVTKSYDRSTAIFASVHPEELAQLLEMKRRKEDHEMRRVIQDLAKIMPELVSMMHSSKIIPGVKFFQGRDGIRKVLFDTLASKTELKDFANIDAMFKYAGDINDEYVAQREKSDLSKRSLLLDTPFAHKVYESGKYSPKSHKGYKWINAQLYPFAIEMNIYDERVSCITYVENDFVGVIIENQYIYQMHDSIWNLLWNMLPDATGAKSLSE